MIYSDSENVNSIDCLLIQLIQQTLLPRVICNVMYLFCQPLDMPSTAPEHEHHKH